jgi:hypothetical protein
MSNNQCQFEPSTQTSSATICKWCGQEKKQHNKQSMKNTNNKEQVADSNGAQTESNYKISNFGLLNVNNNITLLQAAKPLIKYLNDNYHPMCTAIVTLTNVEILEGIECDNTNEFVKD